MVDDGKLGYHACRIGDALDYLEELKGDDEILPEVKIEIRAARVLVGAALRGVDRIMEVTR